MTLAKQQFEIEDGTLSVFAQGPPNGEPVLLLHGIPTNALLFRDVMPIFAEAGYRVLAPHMPGYGDTRLSDDADYSLSAVADRYARWLEAERLAPLWVVGHDIGSALAQFLAVRYPHLVSHLVLSSSPIGDSFPVSSVNTLKFMARFGLLRLLSTIGLLPNPIITNQLRLGFGVPSKLTIDMLRAVFWDGKVNDRQGIKEFIKHLRDLRNTESVEIVPQLADIPMPTLVLTSELERFQRPETFAKPLRDALPDDAVHKVLEDAGHFSPLDTPEAYAQVLLQWKHSVDQRESET